MTFSIQARSTGRTLWLRQGDAISIEFSDGKGVSARIADVDIEPGGSRFALICTPDGRYPDRPLTDVWASRDVTADEGVGYAEAMMLQGDRDADPHTTIPGAVLDAGPETPAEAVTDAPEGDDVDPLVRDLLSRLKRVTIERDLGRERMSELAIKNWQRTQELKEAENARDSWRQAAKHWEAKATTLEQMNMPRTVTVNVPENGTLVVNQRGF